MRVSFFLATLPVFAYSPDYFPLQQGNQWVYRVTWAGQTSTQTVSVTGFEERLGQRYAVVDGLGATPMLLRQDDAGMLLALDASGEHRLADFAAAEGASFPTQTDPCTTLGKVASRSETVATPVGKYPGALHITYTGPCADAGLTSDHYLPWIGLVRRESTTIAGPSVMELVYSRTGGVTVLSQPESSFQLSLNAATLPRASKQPLEARLTLRVTAGTVELDFPSAQRYDFAIRNERGDTVFFWSATRLFAQVTGKEAITAGERNWTEQIPIDGLAEGRYTLEGWLTTAGGKRYAATVGFTITAAE